MAQITYDDFAKLDIKVGRILSAEKVPDADKLIKFSVDVGEETPRTIISGIAEYFPDPEVLVGKSVPVLVNLAPRTIRGVESQGMILYVVGEGFLTTLEPGSGTAPGTSVK
jgi:methionyl-tRNA synthetase